MCQILKLPERNVETIRQLKDFLNCPTHAIVCHNGYNGPGGDDSCLCGIDLLSTGCIHGFKFTRCEDGDYVWDGFAKIVQLSREEMTAANNNILPFEEK